MADASDADTIRRSSGMSGLPCAWHGLGVLLCTVMLVRHISVCAAVSRRETAGSSGR